MAAIEKVKVVVLGDSGVGKTSLTYLIAHNKPLLSPGWTIGCSVEVKLHRYKEGTQAQNTFFVELWDVGGSNGHRITRNVFYQPTHVIVNPPLCRLKLFSEYYHCQMSAPIINLLLEVLRDLGLTSPKEVGIILVHDLTNRKSQVNLQKWLSEILNQDNSNPTLQHVDVDPEQFLGSTQIPILVIGTKFDLAEEKQRKNQYRRLASSIAEQCGADEMFVNCHQARSLAPGTSNSVKLTRFFDKVIERRYYSRVSPFSDKRRIPPYIMAASTPLSSNRPPQYMSPRFYHMD